MLTSHVRRKLETKYDRALLEFLSLYANRLRRWMEQSINALRNGFTEFADMHRAHFEVAPAPGLPDTSAFQSDLRILREWENVEDASAISSTRNLLTQPEKSQTNKPVLFENWKLGVIHARS